MRHLERSEAKKCLHLPP